MSDDQTDFRRYAPRRTLTFLYGHDLDGNEGKMTPAEVGGAPADAAASAVINFTGTTTATSTTVSAISSMAGLANGQEITGVGILAGTTIADINVGASSLTLSQPASYSNTTPMQAYPLGQKGVVPAAPAKSRARRVLTPAGWKGSEPRNWLYKFDDPRRLRRFRAAREAINSGQTYKANAVLNTTRNVLIFGDSPAVGNEPNIPSWKISPWYAAFSKLGDKYRWDTSMVYIGQPEGRLSIGSGWSGSNNFPGLPAVWANYTTTNDLVFTPEKAWDTMDIIYRDLNTNWTYQIAGGSVVTVTGTTPDRLVKLTVTAASLAVQSITFKLAGGSAGANLLYFCPRDSTKLQINGIQLASGGGSIAGAAGLVANNLTGLQSPTILNTLFAPALVVLHFGYEIAGQGSSPGTPAATMVANWITAMNTYIAAWQALGVDVLLMSMHPWDDTNLYKAQATVEQAREAFYAVCDANDVPGIDNFARYGTWSEMGAAGFISHYARPLPAGGWDLGDAVAQALQSI